MKVSESRIAAESDYYIYSPSVIAQNTFFYPICTGHFIYEPYYELHRTSYDSYLLMYIQKGQFILEYEGIKKTVAAGSFVYWTAIGLMPIIQTLDGRASGVILMERWLKRIIIWQCPS